jgi:hypothetical protein
MEKFCEILLFRLRQKKDPLLEPLISGAIQSMEQYRYTCGKIKGLEEAELELKTLYKELLQKETVNPKDWKNNDEIKRELYRDT